MHPILGVELREGYGPHTLGDRRGRLTLLALDQEGYAAICAVMTRRGSRPLRAVTRAPLLDLPDEPSTGLLHMSDDPDVIEALLARGMDPEGIRFLVHAPGAGATSRVRRVAAPDIALLDPEDRELHALRMAIRTGTPIQAARAEAAHAAHLPRPQDLAEWLARDPDAVEESRRVAARCAFSFDDIRLDFLSPRRSEGESGASALAREARARFADGRARGLWAGDRYERRLEREIEALTRLDFTDLPLAALDLVEEARRRNIATAGRGSAAASLVARVFGISQVDPVALGLYFERFARPGRLEPPDLDLDVSSHRREELLAWARRHFGPDRVAPVCAIQTYRARSALREGLRALGAPDSAAERWVERIPEDEGGASAIPDDLHVPGADAAALLRSLVGKPHAIAVHPGGLLLGRPPIGSVVPLVRAPKGVLAAQYDLHALEALGWPKIDLLGNRALAAIEEAEGILGVAPAAPDGDPATIDLLRRADTIGCAQIETPPVRTVLRRLPVRSVRDLMDALALVRPGPGSAAARERFLRRARGEEAPAPLHPRLEELLAGTHGLLLYEEDSITTIAALTGWSIELSDHVRSRLARDVLDPDAVQAWTRDFVAAATTSGVARQEASAIAADLVRFATYAFHQGHAASYAAVAWRSAFLKTHHAAAFACGVLDHYGGAYPLRTVAASFAREGLTILPPHVERSALHATVERGQVRLGLAAVKRLTARTREAILASRPFHELGDLVARVKPSRPEQEALLRSGALEGLAPPPAEPLGSPEDVARYRALVRVRDELATLGMHPSGHPLAALRSEAARSGCLPIATLRPDRTGTARIAAIVAAARRVRTAAGTLQYVTLEDETGLVEAVLPPRGFARLSDPIRTPGPYLLEVLPEEDVGVPRLTILAARPFHERDRPDA